MPGLGKGFALVTRYIQGLRGGTQPILVEASDGEFYVVKFSDNPQGSNVVFNEVMGTELYRSCRLPVPRWKPLLVTDRFLDDNPACWFEGQRAAVRPRAGLCFGSRYLGARTPRTYEILPATRFERIRNRMDFWVAWIVDVCARHTDHRQAIFVRERGGRLRAVFVDQGSMFGGANGTEHFHTCAPCYLDQRLYCSVRLKISVDLPKIACRVDVRKLWKVAEALPPCWKSDSGLEQLALCLTKLTDARELHRIFGNLQLSLSERPEHDKDATHLEPRFLQSVLCAGVHASRSARGALA